jgi:hypothetical protein
MLGDVERTDDMRAGDADRQRVADRLREALDEGRLSLYEFDERVQQAYGAKTYGDLNGLLDDLPTVVPAHQAQLATTPPTPTPAPAGQEAQGSPGRHLAAIWGGWLTASLVTTGVWLATSMASGGFRSFWPIWVIVPFGAVCLARTIRSGFGDHGYSAQRRQDQAARRRERHDRRRRY